MSLITGGRAAAVQNCGYSGDGMEMKNMKAVIVEQIGNFRLADISRPEPGTGEVLTQTDNGTGAARLEKELAAL
ncbi:MAG: hypothetical protein D3906_00410 [Candidatus Electrothrix sp. AUS1_2]|nr:hypothetical protein [Candidatus Electrothrix sp. AUS1_2]